MELCSLYHTFCHISMKEKNVKTQILHYPYQYGSFDHIKFI